MTRKTQSSNATASDKKPFHEVVAEELIRQLETGTAPWQKPWSTAAGIGFLPINPLTGGTYKGINAIHLMAQGRSDSRWLTYKQASAMNAQVRKGERGTQIQYWKFEDLKPSLDAAGNPVKDDKGHPVQIRIKLESPRVFYATVFNAEQVDGLPVLTPPVLTWDPIERAEQILSNSGAVMHHKHMDRAYYSPSKDEIHLPLQAQFEDAANYYATALHELAHWSGHETRLNRDLKHPFGSEAYAREELRAEIASLMMSSELGLPHDPSQHASYVGSWIKALKKDPLEIFRAAADAQKIHTFITGMEPELIQSEDVQVTKDIALSISERSVSVPIVQRMTEAAVLAEVDNRINQFVHQPTIVVRPTAKGVLPGARDGDAISGAVHDAKIFLFLDQLGSVSDVQKTLFHELLHYGLRKIYSREQFNAQMHNLYQRDASIKAFTDQWVKTNEGVTAERFGGADYARARGVDEALARLAEPNAGEFTRTNLYSKTVQNVTTWLAEIAQSMGFDGVAAQLRGIKNQEARDLIKSVFKRLETDPNPTYPGSWESTDTAYSKRQSLDGLGVSNDLSISSDVTKDSPMSSEDKTEKHLNLTGNENKSSPMLQFNARVRIEATSEWLMSVPYGQLNLELNASQMVAEDVNALAGITHATERSLALLAIGRSAYHHKFYADELEILAPEVSAEASEYFRLELAQRIDGLTQKAPVPRDTEAIQTQELGVPQVKTDPTEPPQPAFDLKKSTHDRYNDLNFEGLARKRESDKEKTREEMGLDPESSSTSPSSNDDAEKLNVVSRGGPSIHMTMDSSTDAELNGYQVHQKLTKEYQYDGAGKYYFREASSPQLAFEDRGAEVLTPHHSSDVVASVAMLVHSKGWKELNLRGTAEFKREMWLQATLLGIKVFGYEPEPIDLIKLNERQATLSADRTKVQSKQLNSVQEGAAQKQEPTLNIQSPTTSINNTGAVDLGVQKAQTLDGQLRDALKAQGTEDERVVNKTLKFLNEKIVSQRTYVGELLDFGAAHYKFDEDEKESYFVKLKTAAGEQIVWGVDLARAMEDLQAKGPVKGSIILAFQGAKAVKTSVRVRDAQGKTTGWEPAVVNRNEWFSQSLSDAYALAKQDIELDPEFIASSSVQKNQTPGPNNTQVDVEKNQPNDDKATENVEQQKQSLKDSPKLKTIAPAPERIRRALDALGVQSIERETTIAALADLYESPRFHVGTMLEHGKAPYAFAPNGQSSYYARLSTESGVVLIWGADLARAVRNQVLEGQTVVIAYRGLESVSETDGSSTRRNDWLVAPLKTLHEDAQQGVVHAASDQAKVDAPDFSFMNKRDRQSMEVLAQAMRLAKVPDEIAADTLKQAQGLIQNGPKTVKTTSHQSQAKARSVTPSGQRKAMGPSL